MERIRTIGNIIALTIALFLVTGNNIVDIHSGPNKDFTKRIVPVDKYATEKYQLFQKKLGIQLQEYFEVHISSKDIIGAGVSIVHGDSILFSDGFGKRSIHKKDKINGETVFRLGSLSKGFAGVLAASLQADGKLDFNDKIVDYIPAFKFGDSLNTQSVKLSHIMSHTSGTPYHSFTNLVEAGVSVGNIAKRFKDVTPISKPGIMYSYQNAMFSLRQEVMRKATGKKVNVLLHDRFFKPLGMSDISMDHTKLLQEKNVAMPHSRGKQGWSSLPLKNKYYNAVVAGGINASSLDMAKWMRFLLGHNPEVLSSDIIKEVFNPFIEIKYNNKYYQRWPNHYKSHYGFGWRIHSLKEDDVHTKKVVWHHGGSVNNYRNEIALYPKNDLGICVLLNGNSRLAQTVMPDLYEIVESVYLETYQKITSKR